MDLHYINQIEDEDIRDQIAQYQDGVGYILSANEIKILIRVILMGGEFQYIDHKTGDIKWYNVRTLSSKHKVSQMPPNIQFLYNDMKIHGYRRGFIKNEEIFWRKYHPQDELDPCDSYDPYTEGCPSHCQLSYERTTLTDKQKQAKKRLSPKRCIAKKSEMIDLTYTDPKRKTKGLKYVHGRKKKSTYPVLNDWNSNPKQNKFLIRERERNGARGYKDYPEFYEVDYP